MPAKVDEREYRDIRIEEIEVRTLEDGQDVVEGYATTFDDPYLLWDDGEYRFYESVDRHAYDETDMSDVIMQYNHEGPVYARGGNGTLTITTDDHGLKIRAYLGGTARGKQLLEEIRGRYTTKMSQGFRVEKEKREIVEDKETGKTDIFRTILKVKKLYDVSAVSLPANDATEITSRNLGEGVIAEVKQEKLARKARELHKSKIRLLMEV